MCGEGTAAGGGNGLVFARLLHQHAVHGTPATFLAAVARDRQLLFPETVSAWGIARDRDGTWLLPGYGADGRLDQVYRRGADKRLRPTPGIWPEGKVHALHLPAGDFDPARSNLVVCEGPWDGMALWEAMDRSAGNTNVVAVPGCSTWREEWTQFCRGKSVTLLYDSDHPRQSVGGKVSVAGRDAMARVAKKLSGAAESVRCVVWGPDGWDPARSSGWDVRDFLTTED